MMRPFVRLYRPTPLHMMSWDGNIIHVTGLLCGEFTGDRWIPHTKTSDAELWCFFGLHLNKRLSKQSWGWWFEMPSCSLLRHCNGRHHRAHQRRKNLQVSPCHRCVLGLLEKSMQPPNRLMMPIRTFAPTKRHQTKDLIQRMLSSGSHYKMAVDLNENISRENTFDHRSQEAQHEI